MGDFSGHKMSGHEASDHGISGHEVSDNEMSGNEVSDDESSETSCEGDDLPQIDPSVDFVEKMRSKIVRMVCIDEGFPPLSVVSPSFRALLMELNPNCPLYDFKTIELGCLKYYEEERMKIKQILRNLDGQISLTVETLRSYKTFKIYACVRAHFIDDNWNRRELVLLVQDTDECAVTGAVLNSIKSFEIADKILTLNFQGYHYDPETFDEIKSCIQSHKHLELDGKLCNVHCCAYLFKKMSKTAFDAIDDIIDKLKCIISFPMVDTYWNVINFKLKEALDLKSMGEITRELVDDDDWLSDEEWQKVEKIHELVDKVLTAAKLIFERKCTTTGSNILIGLNDLRESLMTSASSSCLFTNTVAQKMLLRLDDYLNKTFSVLAISAIMDPRCKMVYIKFLSSKSEHPQNFTVLETVHSLYNKYSPTGTESFGVDEDIGSEKVECNNSTVNPLSDHFQDFQKFTHITTIKDLSKSDLDLYLEEPVVTWDDNFDLLAWWRAQVPKYPTLCKMARDILSIQFSILKSSDVYYNEERSVDEKLLATGPVLMNALMSTRSWFQKQAKK